MSIFYDIIRESELENAYKIESEGSVWAATPTVSLL